MRLRSTRDCSSQPVTDARGSSHLRLRPAVIRRQLLCDLLHHIDACSGEFRSQALLRRRPDYVAVLVHQPDGGDRFMLALFGLAALALAGAEADVIAVGIPLV